VLRRVIAVLRHDHHNHLTNSRWTRRRRNRKCVEVPWCGSGHRAGIAQNARRDSGPARHGNVWGHVRRGGPHGGRHKLSLRRVGNNGSQLRIVWNAHCAWVACKHSGVHASPIGSGPCDGVSSKKQSWRCSDRSSPKSAIVCILLDLSEALVAWPNIEETALGCARA